MNPSHDESAPLSTKTKSRAQILFCVGCCCGRTDRGLPEVPVDRIKAAWKAGKFNRTVQLTISGCLGPCDVPNVAVVLTPTGCDWYGNLAGDAHFDAIIEWARASAAEGSALPFPDAFEPHRLRRYNPPAEPTKPEVVA